MHCLKSVIEQNFGDASALAKVEGWLRATTQMARGAAEYGRPAARKDRLTQVAAAASRLAEQFGALLPEDRLDILGPETGILAFPPRQEPPVPEGGVAIAPPRMGIVHHAIARIAEFDSLLSAVEAGARRLAASEPHPARGRSSTPDALKFLIECLAAVWEAQKGLPLKTASKKRGGFGLFVQQVIEAGSAPFTAAQVETALADFSTHLRSKDGANGRR